MGWKINNKTPVYQQIKTHFRSAVLTGQYPVGSRVPSVRELAMEISANPNTVQRAYSELEAEGLLVCAGTMGRFVTQNNQVLEALRNSAIRDAIEHSKEAFKALGISPQEAAQLLMNEKEDA